MQHRAGLSLLCFFACAALNSAWTSKEDAQTGWLRAWLRARTGRDNPNSDDLTELARENPTAYALVKSLLVKNSLGLIKRRPDAITSEDAPTDMDDATGESAEPVAPTHHGNFFNWKPADDSAMVQNVLGQVSSLATTSKTQQKTDQAAAEEIAATASSERDATQVAETGKVEVAASVSAEAASSQAAASDAIVEKTDSIFAKGADMLKSTSAHMVDSSSSAGGKASAGWGSIFS